MSSTVEDRLDADHVKAESKKRGKVKSEIQGGTYYLYEACYKGVAKCMSLLRRLCSADKKQLSPKTIIHASPPICKAFCSISKKSSKPISSALRDFKIQMVPQTP